MKLLLDLHLTCIVKVQLRLFGNIMFMTVFAFNGIGIAFCDICSHYSNFLAAFL